MVLGNREGRSRRGVNVHSLFKANDLMIVSNDRDIYDIFKAQGEHYLFIFLSFVLGFCGLIAVFIYFTSE